MELVGRLSDARIRHRETGLERVWRLPTRSLVTEQSLQADLGNANDRIRHLNRSHLARQLGPSQDSAIGRTASSLLDQLE
jgi:hypothetical protein